jgi:hypothetical protein
VPAPIWHEGHSQPVAVRGTQMLSFQITYEFVVSRGKRIRGASTWTTSERRPTQPSFKGSAMKCDLDNVDVVQLSDGRKLAVFWNDELFGPKGRPKRLLQRAHDLALIRTFERQVLLARSEPTLDGRIGIWVVNQEGKPLFTGIGDLVEFPPPIGVEQLLASVEPTFRWKRSSPSGCAHTNSYIRKDKGVVQGGPQAPPSQPPPDGGPPPDSGPPPPPPTPQ